MTKKRSMGTGSKRQERTHDELLDHFRKGPPDLNPYRQLYERLLRDKDDRNGERPYLTAKPGKGYCLYRVYLYPRVGPEEHFLRVEVGEMRPMMNWHIAEPNAMPSKPGIPAFWKPLLEKTFGALLDKETQEDRNRSLTFKKPYDPEKVSEMEEAIYAFADTVRATEASVATSRAASTTEESEGESSSPRRTDTAILPPETLPLVTERVPSTSVEPLPIASSGRLVEGARVQVLVTRKERNPAARAECIKRSKGYCGICCFDFGDVFGEDFEGLIHVHHLDPIATAEGERVVDSDDLVAVCPNCHTMLHYRRKPESPRTPEELREVLNMRRQVVTPGFTALERPTGATSL